jgi:uncharacterized membrane protein
MDFSLILSLNHKIYLLSIYADALIWLQTMEVLQYIVGIFVILSMIYSVYHCSTNSEMNPGIRLGYIIVIIVLPVIGMVIYFRKDQKKLYYKKLRELQKAKKEVKDKNEFNTGKNVGVAPVRRRFRKSGKRE